MIKRMDKKGQEGMSITTIMGLIIAIVVLIVVVLGFTKGTDWIFDKIGLLPNDLNSATEACKTYADSDTLAISYCQYRELTIEGKKQYMNCDHIHPIAEKVLGKDKVGYIQQDCQIKEEAFCKQLKTEKGDLYKEDTMVNGETCKNRGCSKESCVTE